tara:strand:- start:162 stop:362 length:201 start_codon:yes stop_codon:yes gene_type:complete
MRLIQQVKRVDDPKNLNLVDDPKNLNQVVPPHDPRALINTLKWVVDEITLKNKLFIIYYYSVTSTM